MTFPDFEPTMPAFLRVGAQRYGDRTLVVAGGIRCSYTEAEARSRAVAKGLLADGVGKGSTVGILVPNSVEWAIAFYAATRIGAVAVPINTFFRSRELAWVLRDADVSYLVSRSDFLGADYLALLESALPGLAEQRADRPLLLPDAPFLRAVSVWDERQGAWSRGSEGNVVARGVAAGISDDFLAEVESCITAADRMVIVYSSGSTADPKGAIHTHGTVVRHSMNVTDGYKVARDDVMFSSMPFFWVGGLVTGLLAVQHHGAALVTMDAFEPGAALDLLEQERATIALGWPQQGKTMSEHPTFSDRDLSSIVRTSLPDIVPPERRFPEIHPESLGMTEACSSHLLGDPYVELGEERRGNFGQSVEGLSHKIVDPATGETLPPRAEGEICVRGYSVMQGLQKREREAVFDSEGWYHTGDAGWRDEDGWYYFTGRLGDMIKTPGGTNVTPAELEAVLATYPEVLEAYVVGVPADGTNEWVAAAVVPRAGESLSDDDVRTRLKGDVSAYKVPRYVWICAKSDLPFADSGKIQRSELAARLATRFGDS